MYGAFYYHYLALITYTKKERGCVQGVLRSEDKALIIVNRFYSLWEHHKLVYDSEVYADIVIYKNCRF